MKKTAGVIVYRIRHGDIQVLLVYNGKNWSIPKGRVDSNESTWRACLRELREEARIRVPQRIVYVGKAQKTERERLYCFAGRHEGGRPYPCNEIHSARFFNLNKALDLVEPYQTTLLERLPSLMFAGNDGTLGSTACI